MGWIEITSLVTKIYEIDFQKSIVSTLPKKNKVINNPDTNNYTPNCRTISLISRTSKLLTRIIYKRQKKVEDIKW